MGSLSRDQMRLAALSLPVREKWKLRAWRRVKGTGVSAVLIGLVLILALLAATIYSRVQGGLLTPGPG